MLLAVDLKVIARLDRKQFQSCLTPPIKHEEDLNILYNIYQVSLLHNTSIIMTSCINLYSTVDLPHCVLIDVGIHAHTVPHSLLHWNVDESIFVAMNLSVCTQQ